MKRSIWTAAVASAMLVASATAAAKPPANWDGLVPVKSKRLDLVYLQPGADFRVYTKVLIEPTEVAFHKDWQRDYNRSSTGLSSRVSDREVQEAISESLKAAHDIFTQAWVKGGYSVVDAAGADVLRVKTGIVHIRVTAPDQPTAGRSYSFAEDAGSATLFVEARDSLTSALLGRAVDQKVAGDNGTLWRTRTSNRADFRDMVADWAAASVRGMAELKSLSPIQP